MTTNRRKFLVGSLATAGAAAASTIFSARARAQVDATATGAPFVLSITGLCVIAFKPNSRDASVVLVDSERLPQPLHGHVPMLSIPADCVATSTWAADSVTIVEGGRQYAHWSLDGVDLSIAGNTAGDVALDGFVPDLRTMRPDPVGAPAVEAFVDLKHVNGSLSDSAAHSRIQVPISAIRGVDSGRDRWSFRTTDAVYTPIQAFGAIAECDVDTPTPVVLTARIGGETRRIQLQNAPDGTAPRAYVANLPGHYAFGSGHQADTATHFSGYYELLSRKGAMPLPARVAGVREIYPIMCFPVLGAK